MPVMAVTMMIMAVVIVAMVVTVVVVTALVMGVIVTVIVGMGRHANSGADWRRFEKIRHAGLSRQRRAVAPPTTTVARPVSPAPVAGARLPR
jgi:hypothetical protein